MLPEIVSSGAIVDGFPAYWPDSDTITVPERAKQLVSKQINEKVDFIKVYSGLKRSVYLAIAKASREANIPFAGHVPDNVTIWEAIKEKQKSMEHLNGLLEACTKSKKTLEKMKNQKSNYSDIMKFLLESFDENKFDSLNSVLALIGVDLFSTF